MFADKKRWFKIAGICVGVGTALMIVSLLLVGFDPWKLQSPLPFGVSLVNDGVHVVSDQVPEAPEAPQPPEAPKAPASFVPAEAPAAFDAADKLDLANRAFAHVIDLLT